MQISWGLSRGTNYAWVVLTFFLAALHTSVAQNWFPTSAPNQNWTALTTSADGNKLLAVSSQGSIYTSSNAGASWTQTSAPSGPWVCAAASSDGNNLVAAGSSLNNPIYQSTDSGATWTPTAAPGNEWQSIASSADGRVLVAGAYGRYLYVSTNSGASWTNCILAQYWFHVFCSADGGTMAAVGGGGQSVFISTNSGALWSVATNLPALNWSSLTGSSNGSNLILVSSGGQLFTSTNTGEFWISNSLPNASSGPIAVSGDAGLLVMGTTGAILTSTNLGMSWNTNNAPNNLTWSTVVCSIDGSKLAGVANRQIYISPPSLSPKASVVAWDVNNYGQTTVPLNATNVIAIAGSEYDSLAVRNDGTVLAWGYNDIGETNVPAGLTNVINVAASQQLSLALNKNGTVGWWGWSSFTNIIPSLSNITAVAASQGNFYLALQSNGFVTAWGANSYGQTNVPPSLSNIVAIAVGDSHGLALKNDGTVAVWGGNVKGTSGQTNVPAGLSNVVAIAGGNTYSLAVKTDGSVVGWPTNEANVVRQIPAGLSNVVSVAAGYQHALALTRDGVIWEWGTVGTGFLNYQVGLSNVVAIACGYYHSLAIVSDGSPSVIRQPWNQVSYAGYSTAMSAGVVGSPPLSYQWQLNGTNIDGATNAVLTLVNLQPTFAGSYSLLVSNSFGTIVSSNATLTVIAIPPTLILQPINGTVSSGSNVTFTAAAGDGPVPITYQWQFNGMNIDWATNASLILTNVQPINQGSYNIVVSNNFGGITSSNAFLTVLDLPTALNATGLVWTNTGNVAWFAETTTTHDNIQAAQSGSVANGQQSTLQTAVTGPGTLTFWWMFAPLTMPFANTLSFSTSQSNNAANVSSTSGWQQKTFFLGDGTQTLKWTYLKNAISSGQSTGWVDQVSFIPGSTAPIISNGPTTIFVRANANATFAVGVVGTPPLIYQWQFNGTNLPNKTNASLSLLNVQTTNSGDYSVVITNNYGSISTNAALFVQRFAIDAGSTNLLMTTNGFQLLLNGVLTANPVIILQSTDLVNWLPIYTNPATTGSIQFLDVTATNLPARFYRAQE